MARWQKLHVDMGGTTTVVETVDYLPMCCPKDCDGMSTSRVPDQASALPGRAACGLRVYGISVDPAVPVRTAREAAGAAQLLGWPVALKSAARLHQHRQELSGVRLEIADEEQLRAAFDTAKLAGTCFDLPGALPAVGGPRRPPRHR